MIVAQRMPPLRLKWARINWRPARVEEPIESIASVCSLVHEGGGGGGGISGGLHHLASERTSGGQVIACLSVRRRRLESLGRELSCSRTSWLAVIQFRRRRL